MLGRSAASKIIHVRLVDGPKALEIKGKSSHVYTCIILCAPPLDPHPNSPPEFFLKFFMAHSWLRKFGLSLGQTRGYPKGKQTKKLMLCLCAGIVLSKAHLDPLSSAGLGAQVLPFSFSLSQVLGFDPSFLYVPVCVLECWFCLLKCRFREDQEPLNAPFLNGLFSSGFLGPASTQNLVVKFDGGICSGILVEHASDYFSSRRSSNIIFQTSPEIRHQFRRNFHQLHSRSRWCLDFQEVKRPLTTKSVKRPMKVG